MGQFLYFLFPLTTFHSPESCQLSFNPPLKVNFHLYSFLKKWLKVVASSLSALQTHQSMQQNSNGRKLWVLGPEPPPPPPAEHERHDDLVMNYASINGWLFDPGCLYNSKEKGILVQTTQRERNIGYLWEPTDSKFSLALSRFKYTHHFDCQISSLPLWCLMGL